MSLRGFVVTSVLLYLLAEVSQCTGAAVVSQGNACDPNKLTVYKVLVRTAWSREVFPKQYPEWRPPAQWSKVVGRSHDPSFLLFRMGDVASEGLKEFAELGKTEVLDAQSQGEGGVFDEFNAPPILQGAGQTEAEFFVDGNHSRVSLISRVVPSPDWFIGVDSFDLCVEGKWVESVVLEVDPLDAGTDNGFTFTSPNWPTIPRKGISRITAQSPDHPANSFYYPDIQEHPPIAKLHLVKVKEYELAHVFNPSLTQSSATRRYTSKDLVPARGGSRRRRPQANDEENEFANSIASEPRSRPPPPPSSPSSGAATNAERDGKHVFLNSIVNKYKKFRMNRRGRKMGAGRKLMQRRKSTRRRGRVPRDCRVSEWSEWSSCSKTCGIGEQIRTRTITRPSRRGGRACPSLQETKWCGSSRDCDHKYFDW